MSWAENLVPVQTLTICEALESYLTFMGPQFLTCGMNLFHVWPPQRMADDPGKTQMSLL